jgi:hypothetical protein
MTEKLLPCPFCGGLAVRWDGEPRIVCNSSGCGGEAESEAAWNRRTPAPEGEVVCWISPKGLELLVMERTDIRALVRTGADDDFQTPLYASPVVPVGSADTLERQAAKIKQLEKALAAIGNTPTGGLGCNPEGMVKTARAALTGEDA